MKMKSSSWHKNKSNFIPLLLGFLHDGDDNNDFFIHIARQSLQSTFITYFI